MGAREDLRGWLDAIGLGELGNDAWDQYTQGAETDFIYQWVREQDQYKRRFAGLEQLRQADMAAGMNEVQYLQEERAMSDILERTGLGGTSFNTPEYLAEVIANQVSPDEFETRVGMAQAATTTLPGDVRRQLSERYGVDQNNILAYYLDTDRVEADLRRQQQAAAVAAAYERFQSPAVRTEVFENLARQGAEYGTAAQAFEGLGTLGRGMDQQARLEGAFGLNREVDLERAARRSAFGGGGTASAQQEGVSGLGSATRS